MMKKMMHSKRIVIGIAALGILLMASLFYPLYAKDLPAPKHLLYNGNKDLIAVAPFTPLQMPPFGTDRYGVPILYKILEGAKYTLSFAIVVSFFRIFVSVCMGICMSFHKRMKRIGKGLNQTFSTIPSIFLAYILMAPVYISLTIYDTVPSSQWIIILYQLAVCMGVSVPTLSAYVTEEIDEFMKQEYVNSAILMGASKWYLVKTHIRLFLREKVLILFMQHIVQALILFVHLGLLHFFIGGQREIPISTIVTKYVSLTSEWAGLIGLDRYEFNLAPWIVLSPLCAFAITIFFLNLITEGIKDVCNNNEQSNWEQQQDDIPNYTVTLEKDAFAVLNAPLEKKAD